MLAGGWTLALIGILLDPEPGVASPFPHADKVVHLGLFAGLGFLWTWAERALRRWVFGLAVVMAVGTELVQAWWLEHRSGDLSDLGFDLLGAAVGIGVAVVWQAWTRSPRPSSAKPSADGQKNAP